MARKDKSYLTMDPRVETWKIQMRSGISYAITDNEAARLVQRARQSGLNLPLFQAESGLFIVTSEIVAFEPETWREVGKSEPEEEKEEAEAKEVEEKPEVDKKTREEIEKEVLAEITAKSNCAHPDGQKVLNFQDTKQGRRYFYVCDFCGKRERYIAKDKLPEDELETATPWES